jgi:hypothetical protein
MRKANAVKANIRSLCCLCVFNVRSYGIHLNSILCLGVYTHTMCLMNSNMVVIVITYLEFMKLKTKF